MNLRELPEELKSVAKKQLGEDDARLEEHIGIIRKWLEQQPHINARTDSQWLAGFLRGCKHSLERTKEKLDGCYTMRTHLPEFYRNRDPNSKEISELLDLGLYLPLPLTASPGGPRIVLMRGGAYDPNKHNLLDIFRMHYMIMDIIVLEDDWLDVAGQVTVLDFAGISLDHIVQLSPSLAKKAVTCSQDAYPVRPKSLHFINTPSSFDMVYNICQRFMKDKMKERTIFHSDMKSLFKKIPKNVMPSDYGGDGPSVAELAVEWKRKVMEKRDWFMEDSKFGVDESKRPGKPVSGADLFGVEGSFKQLSID